MLTAAVVLAFAFIKYSKVAHLRRACNPNPSFPTKFYNELLHMHGLVYRAIPSAVTAAAIAWNPSVGKQYSRNRPFPFVLFEERSFHDGAQTVVYTGDNCHPTVRDAVAFMNNFYRERVPIEQQDLERHGPEYGNVELRVAMERVYTKAGGGKAGIDVAWELVKDDLDESEGEGEVGMDSEKE
ncbi:hypothetical protein BT96DRAFT_941133 [Gymnopus androsaceus JB14]|uniref:Cytochrome P450 n=1 Tax=Gymnopus androsaceus JB14 TaxID=1447944 RepID=A0A6A4HJC5_9AGAR|nr:hypothetical protein BT96DRAFT_941133 [Gymnopus androsaceus JB14]